MANKSIKQFTPELTALTDDHAGLFSNGVTTQYIGKVNLYNNIRGDLLAETKSASFAVDSASNKHNLYYVTTSTSDLVATFPAASAELLGAVKTLIKADTGSGNLSLSGVNSNAVLGTQNEAVTIQCVKTGASSCSWEVVAVNDVMSRNLKVSSLSSTQTFGPGYKNHQIELDTSVGGFTLTLSAPSFAGQTVTLFVSGSGLAYLAESNGVKYTICSEMDSCVIYKAVDSDGAGTLLWKNEGNQQTAEYQGVANFIKVWANGTKEERGVTNGAQTTASYGSIYYATVSGSFEIAFSTVPDEKNVQLSVKKTSETGILILGQIGTLTTTTIQGTICSGLSSPAGAIVYSITGNL